MLRSPSVHQPGASGIAGEAGLLMPAHVSASPCCMRPASPSSSGSWQPLICPLGSYHFLGSHLVQDSNNCLPCPGPDDFSSHSSSHIPHVLVLGKGASPSSSGVPFQKIQGSFLSESPILTMFYRTLSLYPSPSIITTQMYCSKMAGSLHTSLTSPPPTDCVP